MRLTITPGEWLRMPDGRLAYAKYSATPMEYENDLCEAQVAVRQKDTNSNAWQISHEYHHHLRWMATRHLGQTRVEEQQANLFADIVTQALNNPAVIKKILAPHTNPLV